MFSRGKAWSICKPKDVYFSKDKFRIAQVLIISFIKIGCQMDEKWFRFEFNNCVNLASTPHEQIVENPSMSAGG